MIPAKLLPPQQSLLVWPEPRSDVGLLSPLPLSTHSPHVASQTSSWLGPVAARAPDLPKFSTPGASLPCPSILILCDSASILRGSGKPALALKTLKTPFT
ncbi:hypothetical protein Nmel_014365 [Mimus melanotis]